MQIQKTIKFKIGGIGKRKQESAERDNSSMLEDSPKICELNLSVSNRKNTDVL